MAKKQFGASVLSVLVFLTAIGTAAAEEIDKNFHQSFNVKEGDSLFLRFGDGDVRLIPWEKSSIDVKVRYRADIDQVGIRLAKKQDFDVEFRQTADAVYVTGKEPTGATIGFYNERTFEYFYEIHSPGYIALDLEGDDGDVAIENWAAGIRCRLDDGDVSLKNIAGGKTTIRGEDGDVEIDNLSGDLDIEVDDGDVRLLASHMGNCRVEVEDGEISISQSTGSFGLLSDDGDIVMKKIEAGGLDISAEDGDVEVDLLATEKLDADIRTEDGNIRIGLEKGAPLFFQVTANDPDSIQVDFDHIDNYRQDQHMKSGSINGGTGRLKIQTDDGDVTIQEGLARLD